MIFYSNLPANTGLEQFVLFDNKNVVECESFY